MFLNLSNLAKHIFVLILSFMLLVPCVWLLNKSYYISISKVNTWEEKEVIGLLTFILSRSDQKAIRDNLDKNLESVRYLGIKIDNGSDTYIDKKINGAEVDVSSTNKYQINGYNVSISRRKYPTYLSDYKKYLSCFYLPNISVYKDDYKRWNDGKSLLYHRNLVFFIAHCFVLFMLEIILVTVSVKYRMNQILASVDNNN